MQWESENQNSPVFKWSINNQDIERSGFLTTNLFHSWVSNGNNRLKPDLDTLTMHQMVQKTILNLVWFSNVFSFHVILNSGDLYTGQVRISNGSF
jgi:hypothetical protein